MAVALAVVARQGQKGQLDGLMSALMASCW